MNKITEEWIKEYIKMINEKNERIAELEGRIHLLHVEFNKKIHDAYMRGKHECDKKVKELELKIEDLELEMSITEHL